MWADSFLKTAQESIKLLWLCSFLAELAVDIPDKIISVFLSYAIYKNLPKSMLKIYKQDVNI